MHIPRYLRTWLVPSPRSIAGVPFDLNPAFLGFLTTAHNALRSCCNYSACGLTVIINKTKQTPRFAGHSALYRARPWFALVSWIRQNQTQGFGCITEAEANWYWTTKAKERDFLPNGFFQTRFVFQKKLACSVWTWRVGLLRLKGAFFQWLVKLWLQKEPLSTRTL